MYDIRGNFAAQKAVIQFIFLKIFFRQGNHRRKGVNIHLFFRKKGLHELSYFFSKTYVGSYDHVDFFIARKEVQNTVRNLIDIC